MHNISIMLSEINCRTSDFFSLITEGRKTVIPTSCIRGRVRILNIPEEETINFQLGNAKFTVVDILTPRACKAEKRQER